MLCWFILWSAILAIYIIQWHIRRKERIAILRKLPGTPPTFLIGNLSWVKSIYSKKLDFHPGVYIFERIHGSCVLFEKYGMHAFWFGVTPIVSVFRAEIMEEILSSSVSLEKSFEYSFLHQWLGRGLLTSTGLKWKSRRRLLTPSFHFRILEDFLPVFNNHATVLVKKIRAQADKEYIDIIPLVILCTLDIICETVMGVHIGAQTGGNSEYVRAVHNLGHIFNLRTVSPLLWSDFTFGLSRTGRQFAKDLEIMHGFTKKVIKEKKESMLNHLVKNEEPENVPDSYQGKKRKAFMDLLLDCISLEQQLDEQDIREEVDTFMFEGHDTTAMGIIFALYCIGLYPEVQKKVTDELDEIFGDDVERSVTHDDVRRMKYLECTLKESQRIYPSVPLIGRKMDENITYEGLTIPAGTTVHLNIIGLHRSGRTFPNPEKFDPDRFLPENMLDRHPYAYIPFSAGPRNCIGQKFAMLEEKYLISNILRHFKVVSLDHRDVMHVKVEFTLRPAQPIRLKFIPRR
ncbi:LOW QUALITY PROTEIN: cytochrome P450 4c3-like [Stegodyphus dumicola]|uniref:LOW QUALITY PROTEIN: cytochrome P450 4c3-like n=1 Tax=Stegodyphus dumicola TaxID=202533 RepID=UPI0015AE7D5F|nr:LOW QUALITY PROTEIN: cytochrome P450 4c3-like [Stegodyphus dumicola]